MAAGQVVADGLTLWHGSQLAIDTTLVSPLHRDATARRRAADHNGVALEHARHRKTATYPELTGEMGRARLVVLDAEVGGRFSSETAAFVNALAKAKSESAPQLLRGRVRRSLQTTLGGDTGVQCSPVLRHVPLGEEALLRNRDTPTVGARGGARFASHASVGRRPDSFGCAFAVTGDSSLSGKLHDCVIFNNCVSKKATKGKNGAQWL